MNSFNQGGGGSTLALFKYDSSITICNSLCNMTTQIHLHMISCKKNPFAYTGTRTHDFASLCQNAGNVSLFVKGEESQKSPKRGVELKSSSSPQKSLIERESIHWVKKNLVMGSPLTGSSTKVPFSSGRGGASGRGVVSSPDDLSSNPLGAGVFLFLSW